MLNIIKISLVAALAGAGLVASAPVDNGQYITVKNNCGKTITVGWLTNGQSNDQTTLLDLNAGASHTITPGNNWGGRVWGRDQCDHSDMTNCGTSGAVSPATLAEFLFNGANNQDYYDVSLVDGFNLPMDIVPIGGQTSSSNQYQCGTPKALSFPACPSANQVKDKSGNVVGCKSTCSATGTPESCCTGQYNTPAKCTINAFAKLVKDQNPTAYSYAYDDSTSTFSCSPSGYTVNLCPA
ncbi:thaumatin [Umbelopsis sp. PMI_123]|nr:thaumatin [Umbelopsis sp. PMI_123]